MANKQSDEENKSIYVVSFQLQTEKWQEHLFDKRFAILNNIYNNLQKKYKRKYHYIIQSKEYKEAEKNKKIKDFFKKYEEPWIKIKKNERVESTYKPFTEYGLKSYSSKFLENNINNGINSVILQSISDNAWKAWDEIKKDAANENYDFLKKNIGPFTINGIIISF